MQNVQYPLQNMQYQTKLSPSYPQSYPQKGATPCKTCSTTCKIRSDQCKTCSTHCKIRSTHCKICSIKQSYPQVIPRVIPKKVLQTCKIGSTHCKIRSTQCKIRSTTCKIRSTPCKTCSTPCKTCSTKQSYPQVIPRVIPNGSVEEKWT